MKKKGPTKLLAAMKDLVHLYYQDILNLSKHYPGDPKVYHLLANHFTYSKNDQKKYTLQDNKILEYYKKVTRSCPNYIVFRDIGDFFWCHLEKPKKAILYYKKALSLNARDKQSTEALTELSWLSKIDAGDWNSISKLINKRTPTKKEIERISKKEKKFLDIAYKKWVINERRQKIRKKFDEIDTVWKKRYSLLQKAKSKPARLILAKEMLTKLSIKN